MNLFKIEPGLFIWTWITFGVLLLLLYKFVFPALLTGIKQREKKIADSMDQAEAIEKRLSEIDAEYRIAIKDAKKEADLILRKVREEANILQKKLASKADKEAATILEEARMKIEEERVGMLNSMHNEIAEFICSASGRLVDKSFSKKEELEWVEKLVDEL
jgi:F-type H+-transporting ATPase subunit b